MSQGTRHWVGTAISSAWSATDGRPCLIGLVLQFDGASWNTVRTGEPYALLGIHGSEPDNIYAVGAARNGERIESAVLHFDGSEWTSKSPGIGTFLWDVLALSTGDYIVVGPDSTLETLH